MTIADALSRQHISERDYRAANNLAHHYELEYVNVSDKHAEYESFI